MAASTDASPTGSTPGTLLVLEHKSVRGFGSQDEYLLAMREDLADWFTCLYQIDINADNFFEVLETGVLMCQHANAVVNFARERRTSGQSLEMKSYFVRSIPDHAVQYKTNAKEGTFLARDNVSNFITWCRELGIPNVVMFETDDLVLRKNERSVILCLLEVARVGAKLGMLAPTIVQMEEEIDAELAGEPPPPRPQVKTCDLKSLDEMVRELVGRCTCPVQFPLIKVGDGKYQIGDTKTLIFVRILRSHVMVRVGGGWDTLEHYLDKHDPCRCNYGGHRAGRRSTTPVPQQTASAYGTPRRTSTTVPPPPAQPPASPAMRSRSPAPSNRRLPQQPPRPDTPGGGATRRPQSPAPRAARSASPAPQLSRSLPRPKTPTSSAVPTPRPNTPVGVFKRPQSPGPAQRGRTLPSTRTVARDSGRGTPGGRGRMEAGQGEAAGPDPNINMEQISTMTLDEFKKLLNSALSVPQQAALAAAAGAAGLGRGGGGVGVGGGDSPSANQSPYRRTNSADFASGSGDGPTPRPAQAHTFHRANSLTSSEVASAANNDPKARRALPFAPEDNSGAKARTGGSVARPQTPTSVSRPTSLALSNSRPKTPSTTPSAGGVGGVTRPKTPTSSAARQTPSRSSVTPNRTTPAEEEDMPDFSARPTTPGLSRERPSTPSLIPRPLSAIPRPVTPAMRGSPHSPRQHPSPVA